MKIVAIIQARMSSTRLPGKVLMSLAGRPVLEHVVARLKTCAHLDDVVVATSTDSSDDAIESWCDVSEVSCFRGSLTDVLDRYYQAAKLFGADAVVRITADCPAIDPEVVDEVVKGFVAGHFDFYGLAGEFPDGLDCTVFGFRALEKAWSEATLPSEREHVGPYVENHPEIFRLGGLRKFSGLAHHRWTLDEPRDFEFLSAVFHHLDRKNGLFKAGDVLELLREHPELQMINQDIVRNEGYLKSLQEDIKRHV